MRKSELAEYLFHQGTNYEAYKFLGCHRSEEDGEDGFIFRVWAPRAATVSVIGNFNNWDKTKNIMEKSTEKGVWALFVSDVNIYDTYKFLITTKTGRELTKSDPYAFHTELRPGNASKIYEIDGYVWDDASWLDYRAKTDMLKSPLNIYEVHIASWRRYADGNLFNYRKFAEEIIPYVKDMGYTHLELMGIAEHPFDGSWGYQVGGYFAVNSRHGTPHDFMYLVDKCHQAGIGVILDWVPGHFPKDDYALIEFDGEPLYEPGNPYRMEHKEWGTRCFDYGREEVQSFLVSNAEFWINEFHIDGLRVDAVASMLYLDYNRKDGDWQQNQFGGKENLEAIAFCRKLNSHILGKHPNVLMIAEESTAWPLVTKPASVGGLGFNFKWNMGWMNDTVSYMSTDPYFRKTKHNNLTFSMMYAFAENFILPLSHDEVVHGKCSLVNKNPGNMREKLAGLKAFLSYQISHPGKKILFMGGEFAQLSEWDYQSQLAWNLLNTEEHAQFFSYIRELNRLYLMNKAMWEMDYSWDGFQWLVVDDYQQNVLVFKRMDTDGGQIVAAHNFAPMLRENYRIPAENGTYTEILNSDARIFGGSGAGNPMPLKAEEIACKDSEYSISISLPPMSSIFLKLDTKGIVLKGGKKAEPEKPANRTAVNQAPAKPKFTNGAPINPPPKPTLTNRTAVNQTPAKSANRTAVNQTPAKPPLTNLTPAKPAPAPPKPTSKPAKAKK